VVEGPLAPYFEPYAEYLADQGYSQVSYWKKTFLINEFSRWLSWEGISVNEITAAHEEAFLRDRASDLEAELEQLAVDARRSPQRIFRAHLPDQRA
jgi:hypothetical protein